MQKGRISLHIGIQLKKEELKRAQSISGEEG
jgi:hypothetical protein